MTDTFNIDKYVDNMETFIQTSVDNKTTITEEDYKKHCNFFDIIFYAYILQMTIQNHVARNISEKTLEDLKQKHLELWKPHKDKGQGSLMLATQGPNLPDVPTEKPRRKRTTSNINNTIKWLKNNKLSNIQSETNQSSIKGPVSTGKYTMELILKNINHYLDVLKIKSVYKKADQFRFSQWLHLCRTQFLSEQKTNWEKWIVEKVSIEKRQVRRYKTFYNIISEYPGLLETKISFTKIVLNSTKIKKAIQTLKGLEKERWTKSNLIF